MNYISRSAYFFLLLIAVGVLLLLLLLLVLRELLSTAVYAVAGDAVGTLQRSGIQRIHWRRIHVELRRVVNAVVLQAEK